MSDLSKGLRFPSMDRSRRRKIILVLGCLSAIAGGACGATYSGEDDPSRSDAGSEAGSDSGSGDVTPGPVGEPDGVPLKQWLAVRLDLELLPEGLQQRLTVTDCCTTFQLNNLEPRISAFDTGARTVLGANAGSGGSHDLLFYDNVRLLFQR